MCTPTHLKLRNSYHKLTRFACVTLTYRISHRQENPLCSRLNRWLADSLLDGTLSLLLIKSGSAASVVGKLTAVTLSLVNM